MKCDGIKQSGYWKGYPCGAEALPGRDQCPNHLPEVLELKARKGKKINPKPVIRREVGK